MFTSKRYAIKGITCDVGLDIQHMLWAMDSREYCMMLLPEEYKRKNMCMKIFIL